MPVEPETVKEILSAANTAVKEANVPAALQEVAYAKAVDLFAAGAGITQAAKEPSQQITTKEAPASSSGAEGSTGSLEQIASGLKVDLADVEEAYHLTGDELRVSLTASQFGDSNSEATRQVALLIAAGRQSGGWDSDWTETKIIREACNKLRVLDPKNFATTIGEMTRPFSFSGQRQGRRVKVKRRGSRTLQS
jgi:hypothetical protein